ncbi:hypothetical protein ISN44_As09g010770 [Arabidopsis suecica]|uniref:DUF4283 domain-containing protein n=1 Tax=Arabidopsis suecica TaxID=45249 RepID=A0A8T2AEP7_ARASU|nr:hypothetical protein ISN44_As09g010770 [Arabidopsis suecica]
MFLQSIGESSAAKKNNKGDEDDDIIHIPGFDYSDLVEKYKNSLVGRMFHSEGRSIDTLIAFMPRARIWDVEGKVQGINLGNGKFQFDFKKEEDLLKVLAKRPCHFNQWSFSLERWEPNIRDDFPNKMLFWIKVSGVPTHYRKTETYQGIGDAIGDVKVVDTDGERIQVSLNGDKPLQFERRVGFDNGDVVKVSLWNLIPRKRAASEERAHQKPPVKRRLDDYIPPHEENHSRDLRKDIQYRRESRSKGIWNRLEDTRKIIYPRHRERYQPYESKQNYQRRNHYEDSYTSSSKEQRYFKDSEVSRRGTRKDDRVDRTSRLNNTFGSDSQRTISEPLRFDRSYPTRKEYHDSRLQKDYHSRNEESRRWSKKESATKNDWVGHGRSQWRVKSTNALAPPSQIGIGQEDNEAKIHQTPTPNEVNQQMDKEKDSLGLAHRVSNLQIQDNRNGRIDEDVSDDIERENLGVPTEEEEYNAYEEELEVNAMDEEMADNVYGEDLEENAMDAELVDNDDLLDEEEFGEDES